MNESIVTFKIGFLLIIFAGLYEGFMMHTYFDVYSEALVTLGFFMMLISCFILIIKDMKEE